MARGRLRASPIALTSEVEEQKFLLVAMGGLPVTVGQIRVKLVIRRMCCSMAKAFVGIRLRLFRPTRAERYGGKIAMKRKIKPAIVQFGVPAESPPVVPPLIVDATSGLLRRIDKTSALIEEILAGDVSTSKEWAEITFVTRSAPDPIDPDLVRTDSYSRRCLESTLLTETARDPVDPDIIRGEDQRIFWVDMTKTTMTNGVIDQEDRDLIRAMDITELPFELLEAVTSGPEDTKAA